MSEITTVEAHATKALEAIILDCQLRRQDVRMLLGFVRRAQEIIKTAYSSPEWLQCHRTERTDETEWMIRDYLEEFDDEF